MPLHRKLFYVLIVLLPTQLGFHTWPAWAYILGRKIDYLSPTLYLTDVIILGIFTLFLFDKKSTIRFSPVYLLGVLFLFTNIYIANNPFVALYAWIKVLEFVFIIYYIVKARIQSTEILFPLSIAVLYSSMIGISQYVLQHSIGGAFWFLGERQFWIDTPGIAKANICSLWSLSCELSLRSYATFSHPNVLGGFLAVVIPFVWYSEKHEKQKAPFYTYFYRATILFGSICLVTTFSRSAWLIFVVSVVLQQIFARKKNHTNLPSSWYYFLLFVVLGVGLFMVPFSDESIDVRKQLNGAAVSIWSAVPFLGVGLGNFLLSLPAHLARSQVYFLQPVHNIYLLLLSEIGVVGWAFIFLGLYVIWKKRVGSIHISPTYYALVSVLLLGLVDHYPLTLQQGQLLFTVVLGLVLRDLMIQ